MKSLLNNLGVQNYFSEKRLISVVFALLYFVICKLGFWWSAPYENASLFWPSLGFAVACVLTFGIYLLPYVFVGKFLALVSMAGWKFSFFFPTTLISCVDLIAVAFAVFLLKRVFRIDRKLESVGDILSLVTAGLLTSLFVTAPFSVIVFSLMDGEGQAYEVFKKSIWLHSLMGHAIGISLFGGTFLLWFSNSLKKLRVFKVIRSLGFAALFSCILGGVYFIFQDGKLLYLLLPPMMLSSFFMTPRQVSTLLALIAPLVISPISLYYGPWKNEMSPLVWASLYIWVLWTFSMVAVILVQRLTQTQEMLKEISFAKSRFLTRVSHEFRTPLNSILGLIEQLQETELSTLQKSYTDVMQRTGNNLVQLVSEVLDLSRIESGKLHLDPSVFSVESLADEIRSLFAERLRNRNLHFGVRVDSNVPEKWTGDISRVRQVLVNLLSNAAKFTNSGKVIVEIRMEKRLGGGEKFLEFVVTDSGIGIGEDKLQMIFEPFTQADNSLTRRYGGTGLGLSICRELVHLMKGRMTVESKLGVGSVFKFSIPQAEVMNAESMKTIDVMMANHSAVAPRAIPQALARTQALKILLVDDNVDNRFLIRSYLKGVPALVEEAENGRVAIEQFEKQNFDLVLMDIEMPEVDGFEATKSIRILEKNRLLHRTPIIAITAHALEDEREKMLSAGSDYFLIKPISKTHFLKSLHLVLDRGLESSFAVD